MDPSLRRHEHEFDLGNPAGERGTRAVVALSLVMMVIEIAGGLAFGSMALLADGWHMATHVAALGIAVTAYWMARRYAGDARFAFGTWKIEVLGGFVSAVVLGLAAAAMVVESIGRFFHPETIQYQEALAVAGLGLVVNLVSIGFLHRPHAEAASSCTHDAGHRHAGHRHGDLNLRAAMTHVVADAATSVFAILALLGGWYRGWGWLDPVGGLVGGVVIAGWAWNLARESGRILLDYELENEVVEEVRQTIASVADVEVIDLHVWRVGRVKYACIASILVAEMSRSEEVRRRLRQRPHLAHITLEVFLRSTSEVGQIDDFSGDR